MIKEISDNSMIVVSSQQILGDLLDGEVAILNLSDGVYYGLNDIGGRIWSLIQQPKTVGEIKATLLQEYDVDPDLCYRELLELLEDLANRGLVVVTHDPVT